MKLNVNGKEAYYTSSGRDIDKNQPSIVFVHGSGLSHVTWVLQTRYFAFHGYNTIAVDLPGHGDSEGPPLKTIEEMADWVADLLTSLGIGYRESLLRRTFSRLFGGIRVCTKAS